jgi:amino acid adenylation domain-containing protein
MNNSKQTDLDDYPVLFWKQQPNISAPLVELPTDFPRSSTTSCQINHVFFSLSASCGDALKQLSNQLDTTIFTILFSAYNTLLFRYTRQEDIVIGLPILENNSDDTGKLIDTLHHTKPFRTGLSGNPCFDELIKRVNRAISVFNNHTDTPFEPFENAEKVESGINYTGSHNVIFSYRNTGIENDEINNLISNISIPGSPMSAVDIALSIKETTQGIKGVWTYNSELFEAATIKRIAKHFEILLETIVLNPRQTISQIQFLTDRERYQLILEWNSSKVDYNANKCIHELFEEQVRKTPEATALVFENKKLTYKELNEHANQLARYLCSKGIKQETLVPICMSRSLEMAIGILGILKAGGTYVPVDPNYPLERIAYLFEDIGASLVVCDRKSKIQLKTFENIEFAEFSIEGSFLQSQSKDNLNIAIAPENLAYIIYTSGSTGKPKGVMIEHRNTNAFIAWCKQEFALSHFDIIYACTSICFDLSVFELFYPLSIGKLVRILENGLAIGNYLTEDSAILINTVPSVIETLIHEKTDLSSVSVINMAGEIVPPRVLEGLDTIKTEVRNLYGPTEDTTYSTVSLLMKGKPITIGKPISNTQIYILDLYNGICPIGVTGEIHIGGSGLARGYFKRSELTAEKFIKDHFSEEAGARLYKTGDLGRWLPDGNIEYLGRIDNQVKIRGYRIELGEIETVLNGSPLVLRGVVLAKVDSHDNKRLVGYVVPQRTFDKQAVQKYLNSMLPEYMVPAIWIEMEKLPLTPNGKIDRKALPDPQLTDMAAEYAAPRNAIEEKLAEIWRELLSVERVGVNDNFFELGGNSISAAFLFAKIKRKFHKSLPLVTIINAPTIYQLAIALKTTTETLSSSSSLVPIQPNGSKTPLFAVHAGAGNVLFYQRLSLHLGMDQPFYAFQAKGINGTELPLLKMDEMVNYYISELRKVQPEGPYYLAGYCFGADVTYEMAYQLAMQGEKIGLLANFNGVSPTYYRPYPSVIGGATETPQAQIAKASTHFNAIKKLSFKNKISYIYKKLKKQIIHRFKKLYFLLRFKLYGLIFRIYLFCKQKVPAVIARKYVGNILGIMEYNHKPKPYSGSMMIFRSPGIYKEPYLGWKSFVKGKIKTFDIQGLHESRRDIMNEPYVQFLAKELKSFLDN